MLEVTGTMFIADYNGVIILNFSPTHLLHCVILYLKRRRTEIEYRLISSRFFNSNACQLRADRYMYIHIYVCFAVLIKQRLIVAYFVSCGYNRYVASL
jgi:hypothetical protein